MEIFWKKCKICKRRRPNDMYSRWPTICDDCFDGKTVREPKKKAQPKQKYSKCFLWVRHKIVYKKGKGYICKYCRIPQVNVLIKECDGI